MAAPAPLQAFSPNVILVDADYIDRVAFDLSVNFERMIGRQIPPADLPHWLDCIALDGGLRPGDNAIDVFFLHSAERDALRNFRPSAFATDLDARAFRDNLGEFNLHSFAVESLVTAEDFFVQALEVLGASEKVERLMVVGDMERSAAAIRGAVQRIEEKEITLFAMEPLTGRGFYSEILGYSLMSALGISSDELR